MSTGNRPHPILAELTILRLQAGYSQTRVAKAIGSGQGAVSGFEIGRPGYQNPSIHLLERWAAVFGLEIALVQPDPDPEA
jgi:transcriptional regulator with XRE-family HTH domain